MILKIPDVRFVTRTSHAVAERLLGPKRTSEDTHPMSLSGAKRTWPSHREMSAYDPKRTFARDWHLTLFPSCQISISRKH